MPKGSYKYDHVFMRRSDLIVSLAGGVHCSRSPATIAPPCAMAGGTILVPVSVSNTRPLYEKGTEYRGMP